MDVLSFLILLICFVPVWVPVLIAFFGRSEPVPVRIVLASSGILAGTYAAFAFEHFNRSSSGGGSFAGLELLFIPFRSAILSFFLAFAGVCLVAAIRYALTGRLMSAPGVAAGLLFISCIVAGVLFGSWLFTWPQ